MSKKIIHVNRQFIASNLKGHNRPVFTIKEGGKTKYARQVKILGDSNIVYSEKPLSCGARAWIETESEIVITGEMTFADAKAL